MIALADEGKLEYHTDTALYGANKVTYKSSYRTVAVDPFYLVQLSKPFSLKVH